MAAALIECLRAPERAWEMAEHGRRFVLEHYDWGVLAEKLEVAWERCLRLDPSPRVATPGLA
jgi:hypothetical protein